MLTIHHLGGSQSERIAWLCEELDLPYDLIRYDRDSVTRRAPADYKALYPFGTAPVIDDGPIRLGESGAIIEYIIHTHGGGRLVVAPGASNYADYLYWWHFANGSFVPAVIADKVAQSLGGADAPIARSMHERHGLAYHMIEERLGAAAYFAGDQFTAADIAMVFPLTTMRSFSGKSVEAHPNIRAYLHRIGQRAAYRRAMEKGDPDMVPLLA